MARRKTNLYRRGARFVFLPTKLSIVTPVLDSHAIVRRLILYYKKMRLPDDVEIIFVDDNSDPPLREFFKRYKLKRFHIYPTGDTRNWSIACSRNLGIQIAQGEYIFNTDVDHILSEKAIGDAYNFTGDKMFFRREWGVLDNRGNVRQDKPILKKYGWEGPRIRRYYHVGTHVIKKKIVEELDGYPVRTCDYGTHPTREDRLFYQRYARLRDNGVYAKEIYSQSPVYCFPGTLDKSAHLFHGLHKKTKFNAV
jgi:glycosyltransferase involved in cell wall biosynthesis